MEQPRPTTNDGEYENPHTAIVRRALAEHPRLEDVVFRVSSYVGDEETSAMGVAEVGSGPDCAILITRMVKNNNGDWVLDEESGILGYDFVEWSAYLAWAKEVAEAEDWAAEQDSERGSIITSIGVPDEPRPSPITINDEGRLEFRPAA